MRPGRRLTHRFLFCPRLRVATRGLLLAMLLCAAAGAATDPKSLLLGKDPRHPRSSADRPAVQYTAHNRGNIQLAVANNGTFGTQGGDILDPFTGELIQSCIFPKGTDLVYLWVAAVWIGAVVGRDTLVSVGTEDYYVTQEFWPEVAPFGNFRYESIDPSSQFYSPTARSEQDIICEYTDTVTDPTLVQSDSRDNRPHKPLGIKVYQRSMAWSYSYAEDFILFDYQVENIGEKTLKNVYLALWVDGDVWHTSRNGPEGWNDDLVGFYHTHADSCASCEYIDTIAVAYHTDGDGDPVNGAWDYRSVPHAVGVRVVRTPSRKLEYAFNWWITDYGGTAHDFGPRRRGTPSDPFRDFGGRLGTPLGDRNKYYVMRDGEFDYDQLFVAKDHTLSGWLPPPENADSLAAGWDVRYLLSFGPFEILPGQRLPISFVWLGGENLHAHPTDFADLFDPREPEKYYASWDFSDLARNSRWASWVYDNPGMDTDGDGYRGRYEVCVLDSQLVAKDTVIDGRDTTINAVQYTAAETCWVEGDGVPDWVGAGPPPAPAIRITPSFGRLTITFNGLRSETTKDIFSGIVDFEGYRVYLSRDDHPDAYALITSWDRDDYNKYLITSSGYKLLDIPFTREQLQVLYGDPVGDPNFDPLRYTAAHPYVLPGYPDSQFFFRAQDYNATELGEETRIFRLYPDQPYPSSLDPDSARADELTEDGYLKYFDYQVVIDGLLSNVPYWVNVTAFDFGSPIAGLPALESSIMNGEQEAYALGDAVDNEASGRDVYVYPNPYRVDDDYVERGLENRRGLVSVERARRLHFANLPPQCTISIYSLDGDLIRVIDHDVTADNPTAAHEEWDLISRNHQPVVSGLYYFVVESASRTQIGKFAVIK